jgi:GNAT superfamily N-acetyltransferase
VSVRIANEDDLPDLARLLLAFRDHLDTGRPTEEALLSFLPEVLADSTTEFCLAHSEAGDAVGFTQCRYFRSVWESGWKVQLEDLFVVEPLRGQGIGARLMALVIERASTRGAVAIVLNTNERNEAAQAFYRRAGFSPVTEQRWRGGREFHWVRAIDRR